MGEKIGQPQCEALGLGAELGWCFFWRVPQPPQRDVGASESRQDKRQEG